MMWEFLSHRRVSLHISGPCRCFHNKSRWGEIPPLRYLHLSHCHQNQYKIINLIVKSSRPHRMRMFSNKPNFWKSLEWSFQIWRSKKSRFCWVRQNIILWNKNWLNGQLISFDQTDLVQTWRGLVRHGEVDDQLEQLLPKLVTRVERVCNLLRWWWLWQSWCGDQANNWSSC